MPRTIISRFRLHRGFSRIVPGIAGLIRMASAIAGVVLLTGCQTLGLGGTTFLRVTGTFTHEPTGMAFPDTLNTFARGVVAQYDAGGFNLSFR